MKRSAQFFEIAGIVAAATVGDGVFALPYVFANAGWLLSLFYLALVIVLVVSAHVIYLKTLEAEQEKERLLGLAEKRFGATGFWIGFIAIVVGLLLTLVAYLVLGAQFIHLILPSLPTHYGFVLFWLCISALALASDKEVRFFELAGIACTSLIIIIIFISAWPTIFFANAPVVRAAQFFLPFGAVLFSLAGWTSIEPAYEIRKRERGRFPWVAIATGTLFAASLYIMFTAGVLGSSPLGAVTPDTASGLAAWPLWKKDLLAALGLFAVATVYLPIAREIKNSLERDLGWPRGTSRPLIVFFPAILIVLGLNNFLTIVGLVGGVFLSVQYLLIILVGRRSLRLGLVKTIWLDVVALVFAVAAVYSVYSFIVR